MGLVDCDIFSKAMQQYLCEQPADTAYSCFKNAAYQQPKNIAKHPSAARLEQIRLCLSAKCSMGSVMSSLMT